MCRRGPKNADTDGVGVVAILNYPEPRGPSLLLQKQFRPPINKVTIEVPSGLIDPNESAQTCAIRELKEETGYIATIPRGAEAAAESFVMHNDPGFCNTNTKMIFVEVDMSDERNQEGNLKPELEENEFIQSFSIPLKSLWDDLKKLDEEGFAVDARVGTLAQGMEVAKKWKL